MTHTERERERVRERVNRLLEMPCKSVCTGSDRFLFHSADE